MTESQAYYDKMTRAPLARLIISLGIPTTISMLVTNIYNMVDTYFVGTLGESQQAATGILFTLQAIIQAIAFMLGQGSGSMVSKALADQDTEEASEYVSTGFFTGAALGTILMVVGLIFLTPFMRLLGSTETILPYAKQYGVCVLVMCPVVIGSFVLNNNLRYEGKAFYAMIGLVSGGVINILGDYLLIKVIPLGVLGAGIATAVSQFISFLILLYFYKKMAQGKIRLHFISKKINTYLTICRVGFPALIRQGLSSISSGLLNNLTRPYGDAAIAAMSVVNRFTAFVMCVGLGVGQGFQPVCGFNYGAKLYERVLQGFWFCVKIAFVFLLCVSTLGFIFAPDLISLFRDDPQVIAYGATALRFQCVTYPLMSWMVMSNMMTQSMGLTVPATFLAVARQGLFFIPLVLTLPLFFDFLGVQITQSVADILTFCCAVPIQVTVIRRMKQAIIERDAVNPQ